MPTSIEFTAAASLAYRCVDWQRPVGGDRRAVGYSDRLVILICLSIRDEDLCYRVSPAMRGF